MRRNAIFTLMYYSLHNVRNVFPQCAVTWRKGQLLRYGVLGYCIGSFGNFYANMQTTASPMCMEETHSLFQPYW